MFAFFVAGTLWITKWAAAKTKSAADFYTAGGGITGFQNGLAIAGDYMSAASFLGISGLVFANGFDGLIFSIGWLVGWPIITFLMAERLRNLGKVHVCRRGGLPLRPDPGAYLRSLLVAGRRGVLHDRADGRCRSADQDPLRHGLHVRRNHGRHHHADVRAVRRHDRNDLGADHQGLHAARWRHFMAISVLMQFGFSPEALFTKAVEVHSKKEAIMAPGALIKDPISAISVGMALMFGTAGLPHILQRFFTVPNAKEARKSVAWATTWIGYFYILTFIIGFGAITNLIANPGEFYVGGEIAKGPEGRRQHGCRASLQGCRW